MSSNHKAAPQEVDDALARLSPSQAQTLRLLQARDDALPADPAFAERLRAEIATLLVDREPTMVQPGPSTTTAPRPGPVIALPERRRGRRRSPYAELAAAVLILVTLAGGFFAVDRLRSGSPGTERRPAPQIEQSDVPMFRGNAARTGEMPGPGPASEPSERWTFQEPNFGQFSSAVVVDGVIYLTNSGFLRALDASTGEERWSVPVATISSAPIAQTPAVANGLVYVGSADGYVHAFDAESSEERWSFNAGYRIASSPAVVDGVVYVATGNYDDTWGVPGDTLFALDAATGEEIWSFPIHGSAGASPAVVDGIVYVAGNVLTSGSESTLYAVDAATGEQRWAFPVAGWLFATPAVVDGTVFLGTGIGQPEAAGPSFGETTGIVYALDAATGTERWRADTAHGVFGAAAVAGGTVFVADYAGVLSALGAERGDRLWEVDTDYQQISSPTVAGGVVYFGTGDGTLLALDPANGDELWRYEAGSGVISSPVVLADGVAYFGALGIFFALGDADAPATPAPGG